MGFPKIIQGKRSLRDVVKSKIMNLLNITTHDSRSAFFSVPLVRTAFRRERKNRRNKSRLYAHPHSHSGQQVRLEFFHPQAREVNIAGSFNDWRPGSTWMVSLGNGRWVKELLLPPGRYEYCFVVDGHWMPDPKATQSTHNGSANHNSVLLVSRANGNCHSRHFVSQPPRNDTPHTCGSTSQTAIHQP